MFLARSASLRPTSRSATAPTVSVVSGSACTVYDDSDPSSSGLESYPTLRRLRFVKSSELAMIVAPTGRGPPVARRAAGCRDGMIGEVQLEGADPGQCAGRRADLGREVWQRGQIIAPLGRLAGE